MDLHRVSPALLLWLHVAAAQVLPPTDVDLHCRNLQNRVVWRYGHAPAGLRFRIDILELSGTSQPLWVDPPTLQADVSFLSDPTNDYYLTVTAVMGSNESDPAPSEGILFSYYSQSQATKKCSMDLPPVNVSLLSDGSVEMAFEHPWLTYQQLMPASMKQRSRRLIEEDLPIFKYTVDVINQMPHHDECVEEVCQQKFAAPSELQKICLSVTGELEKIYVVGTQEYCAKKMSAINSVAVVCGVLIPLVLLLAVLVLCMVVRKKTTPSSPSPNATTFSGPATHQAIGGAQRETVYSRVVESPSETQLVRQTSEDDSAPLADVEGRLPIRRLPEAATTAEEEEEE